MIDIQTLERRWLNYKLRSYLPKVIVTILFLSLGAILFYFFLYKQQIKQQEKVNIETNSSTIKQLIQPTIQKQQKKEESHSTPPATTLLQPSYEFLDHIQKEEKKAPKPHQTKKREPTKKKIQKINIQLKRVDTSEKLNEIIQRFNTTNDPKLSLFIAKKYYDKHMYKNAYNYALKTNKLDSNIEDSWIIFTKALIKLNKKQMAVDILNEYVRQTNSQKAKLLLQQVQNGTFR